MSDIFVSYKRIDEERVRKLLDALKNDGFEIGWDQDILPTLCWRDEIPKNIDQAKVVMVLWTKSAEQRPEFLVSEAEQAMEQKKLLSVLLEDVPLPKPFGERQALNLKGWDGDIRDRRFRTLVEVLRKLTRKTHNLAPGKAGEHQSFRLLPMRNRALTSLTIIAISLILQVLFPFDGFKPSSPWPYVASLSYGLPRLWLHKFLPNDTRPIGIVTLDRRNETEEVMGNLCLQRSFTSRLLRKIAQAEPSVIVLDAHYMKATCPEQDDNATRSLHDALSKLGNARIKTVVALYPDPDPNKLYKDPTKGSGQLEVQVLKLDQEDFVADDKEHIQSGLVREEEGDLQRLALSWPIYLSDNDSRNNKVTNLKTLAWMASIAFDVRFEREPILDKLQDESPFTSRTPKEKFKIFSASQVLCGQVKAPNWRVCESPLIPELRQFPIILVGLDDPDQDIFQTSLGKMPGVVLQANSIFSILNKRIYRPVQKWIQALLESLYIVAIGLIVRKFGLGFKLALLLCGITALIECVIAIILAHEWMYLEMWVPLASVILMCWLLEHVRVSLV